MIPLIRPPVLKKVVLFIKSIKMILTAVLQARLRSADEAQHDSRAVRQQHSVVAGV